MRNWQQRAEFQQFLEILKDRPNIKSLEVHRKPFIRKTITLAMVDSVTYEREYQWVSCVQCLGRASIEEVTLHLTLESGEKRTFIFDYECSKNVLKFLFPSIPL